MLFFQLVRREMQGSLNRLLIMFGVGGISIASILAAINAGAHAADSGKPNLWAATLFIVALLLFIKTQNFNLLTTTAEIEAIIRRMRVRLMSSSRSRPTLIFRSLQPSAIASRVRDRRRSSGYPNHPADVM